MMQERNEIEDEELSKAVVAVGMPTTQAGFKNHALSVDSVTLD